MPLTLKKGDNAINEGIPPIGEVLCAYINRDGEPERNPHAVCYTLYRANPESIHKMRAQNLPGCPQCYAVVYGAGRWAVMFDREADKDYGFGMQFYPPAQEV